LSTLERAFSTFVSSFIGAILLSGAFNTKAADVALFAAASAALAVVTAAIRSLTPPAGGTSTDEKILDVVTRVGLTLVQTFTAAFVTNTAGATHFSDWRAGALAGLAAVVTALKGTGVIKLLGGTGATPASLLRISGS